MKSHDALRLGDRTAGILLHLASLPGPHGNGGLGPDARRFVDFLRDAGLAWWQMLPVHPVGSGNSPYSALSVFAGSPSFISLEDLRRDGLLKRAEVSFQLPGRRIDYTRAPKRRAALLRLAFGRMPRGRGDLAAAFERFRHEARAWLDDYTLFIALRARSAKASWVDWDRDLARRDHAALRTARRELTAELDYLAFEQFVFARQWAALRNHARSRGVGLIGDAPIFVAHDSADAWANQRLFRFDRMGRPTHVSGVPPDHFSETGQRWGTPLYRWDRVRSEGFRWWVQRFASAIERFDVVRLDHFIGFVRYWEIPSANDSAVHGRWRRGPGAALFEAARADLGHLPFIAEDLGSVTPDVIELRDALGLPGMRVLQFGFGADDPDNPFLPHNYPARCVAYTGTHDNDTMLGWYLEKGGRHGTRSSAECRRDRDRLTRYVAGPYPSRRTPCSQWEILRVMFSSAAATVIVPMQDLLGRGSEARMNVPGRVEGNWTYRLAADAASASLASRIRAYVETYGRVRG